MSNVYILKPPRGNRLAPPIVAVAANPFDDLTDRLVLERAAAGTLDPAIVAALLAAVRRPASECGR